jgi:hypothetical protein
LAGVLGVWGAAANATQSGWHLTHVLAGRPAGDAVNTPVAAVTTAMPTTTVPTTVPLRTALAPATTTTTSTPPSTVATTTTVAARTTGATTATTVAVTGSAPATTALSCPNGSYVNVSGDRVCSPYAASTPPAGASAQCKDGTYSLSEHRSGTCSGHGGVAQWLRDLPS